MEPETSYVRLAARPRATSPGVAIDDLLVSPQPLDRDDDTNRPSVSVVIPTLNEAQNIARVLQRLPSDISEVVIVDGNSTDDTVSVARWALPSVRVVAQSGKGKGDALTTGIMACTSDIVVLIDADGSTDPIEIPRFVVALETGADLAKGTRFVTGGGSADLTTLRRLGNRALTAIVNVLFRTNYSDLCYGYNAMWTSKARLLNIDCAGFEIETLINIRSATSNWSVVEVPSFEHARYHGQSKLRALRDGARIARTIMWEFTARLAGRRCETPC